MRRKRFLSGFLLMVLLWISVYPAYIYAQIDFTWSMSGTGPTSAGIYDSTGRLVRTLWAAEVLPNGTLNGNWDGLDDFGNPVPAGNYTWKVIRNDSQYNNIGAIGNTGLPTYTSGHVPYFIEGVATDAQGNVYSVHDWDEPHFDVIKWSADNGQALMNTGHPISGALLKSIAVEPDGSYAYVTGYGGDLTDRTQSKFSIWRINLAPGLADYERVENFTAQGQRIKVYNGNYGGYPSEGYPTPAYPSGATEADKDVMNVPLVSIAVDGPDSGTGSIYVTDAIGGRVLRYEKVTGIFQKQYGNLPVAAGLAIAPDGKIWVGHQHSKVSVLDPVTGNILATPITNLTEVRSLSIRNVQGVNTLAVADRTGKIREYSIGANGTSLTQIGSEFGKTQRPGDSAPARLSSINGMTMDASGNIIVSDRLGDGSRLQKFNTQFTQQWQQLGLEFSSTAAYGASSPDTVISSYRKAYQVNKTTGQWSLLGTAKTETSKQYFGNYESTHAGPPKVVNLGGNDFYYYPTGDSVAIYRIMPAVAANPQDPTDDNRGPTLKLVSVLGGSQPGPDGLNNEQTWIQANKFLWSWNDTEGDGEIDYVPRSDPGQAGEVKIDGIQNYPHYQWQWVRRGYEVDSNGWIWFASANRDHVPDVSYPFEGEALYVIQPRGLNSQGNPIYDWSDAIKVMDGDTARNALGLVSGQDFEWKMVAHSEDGMVYALAYSNKPGLPQDSAVWMGGNVLFGFQMPNPSTPSFLGSPKWWVPLPQKSVGMVPISGGAGGVFVGINPSFGVVGHYNKDGMLIGSFEAGTAFREAANEPWVVGRLDTFTAINSNRDPRDGILDVFTEDNLNMRILWFRVNDSNIQTIATGSVSASGSGGTRYTLTVNKGIGDGSYVSGTTVNLIAAVPPGQTFVTWTGDTSGVADVNSPITTVTMSGSPKILTATFSGGSSVPAAPANLTATAGDGQVTLSWSASSGAASYNIYRGTSAGGESTTPIYTGVTGTTKVDTGLTNGTSYYYTVKAVNASGTSNASNEASATPALTTTPDKIRYYPRATYESRMVGGIFEATNGDPVTGPYTTIHTITTTPTLGWTEVNVSLGDYRYLRYRSANGSYGNVSEIEFYRSGTKLTGTGYGTAGSFDGGGNTFDKALDGNTSTYFDGPGADGNYVGIDKGVGSAPAAPTNLTATAGDSQVTLSWSTSSGATSYNVYRGTSSGGESTTPVYTGVTGTTKVDSGLTNGTTYYYTVKAVNTNGTSAASNEVSAIPAAAATGSISREVWTGVSGTGISDIPVGSTPNITDTLASFEAPTDWADGYGTRLRGYITAPATGSYTFWIASDNASELWLSTDSNPANKVKIAWVNAWTNSREWTKESNQKSGTINLTQGQTYYVEALQKEGDGGDNLAAGWAKPGQSTTAPSEVIPGSVLTPFNGSSVPSAPANLMATAGDGQITLSWSASSGATSYNVYRGTSAGGENPTPVYTGVTGTTQIDTGLTNGTTYYYTVKAVNANGTSAASNEASATPATATGSISREVWTGVSGNRVLDIPLGTTPNITDTLTSFEAPTNWGDGYGTRLRGYITAQETGSYTFWVASDDEGELWLSTDSNPANKVKIASVNTWTNSREWTKESGQKSVAINLIQGQTYYVEALQKDGEGGDNLAVGWAKPGQSTTAPSEVIPGSVLSPFNGSSVPAAPANLTATAGDAQVALSWTASSGATSYNVKRSTTSGSGYVTVASPTGTSFTDTGLTNGTTYYYVVTAVNVSGESVNSSQASATPVGTTTTTTYEAENGTVANGANIQNDGSASNGQVVGSMSNSNASVTWSNVTGTGGNATIAVRYGTPESGVTKSLYINGTKATDLNLANTGGWASFATITATVTLNSGTNTIAIKNDSTNSGSLNIDKIDVTTATGSAPAAPANLTATAGDTQVTLSWSASSGATSYNVKRSTTSGSGYVTTGSPTGTSFTNTGLTNGTTYYYVVTAVNASGESNNSSQISVTPVSSGSIPAAPTGLTATPGNAQITLSWTASSGATSYNVKRSTTSGSGYVTVASPTGTSFTDTGLTNGTTYYYVVTAVNTYGESGSSSQASAIPTGVPGSIPAVPTGLASTVGDGQVTLSWSASSGATSYNVKRSTTTGIGYITITNVTSTSYTDTGLTNGTTYYYVVSAVNSSGESGNSFQKGATPINTPPAAPVSLAASGINSKVTLFWSAISGATGYNVKRSTTNGGPYTTITSLTGTSFTDTGLNNGTTYYYVVSAVNAFGESGNSSQTSAAPSASSVQTYEAEDGLMQYGASTQYDSNASQGETVGDMHKDNASITWSYVVGGGGSATLTIRYASSDVGISKGLFINGTKAATLNFPSTGGWGGSFYGTISVTMTLNSGVNIVSIKNDLNNPYGVNIDKMDVQQ